VGAGDEVAGSLPLHRRHGTAKREIPFIIASDLEQQTAKFVGVDACVPRLRAGPAASLPRLTDVLHVVGVVDVQEPEPEPCMFALVCVRRPQLSHIDAKLLRTADAHCDSLERAAAPQDTVGRHERADEVLSVVLCRVLDKGAPPLVSEEVLHAVGFGEARRGGAQQRRPPLYAALPRERLPLARASCVVARARPVAASASPLYASVVGKSSHKWVGECTRDRLPVL
jgi:hypothetical protein